MYKIPILFILLCLLTQSFSEPTNGCPTETPVKYYNGTCLASCEYPFTLQSDLCDPDCPSGQYLSFWTDRCLVYCDTEEIREEDDILFCDQVPESDNANGCPFSHDYKYSDGSCLSTCPDPYKAEGNEGAYLCKEADCVIQSNSDGSKTTTCKDITGKCLSGYFLFDDSSCNKVCPSGFSARKNAICAFPCGKNSALYPNGRCLDTCISGYTLRMEGNFMVCDKDEADSSDDDDDDLSSATVEIYLRYNIPFKDFNSGGYLAKFITMITKLLDISSSDIKILSLKEGSTMIQSEVAVTSKSLKSTTSKANALNQKLTEAVKSNNLNLEGISVLNHHFSVALPEKEQSGTGNNKSPHKKSLYALAVGLGVAVLILLVVCKYSRKHKFFKVKKQAEEKPSEVQANSVSETPASPKQKKDEEICSFVVLHNSVSRDTTDQISPLPQKILPEAETFKFAGGDLEINHLSSVLKSARQKQTEEIELCKNGSEKYNIEEKLGAIEEVQEAPLSMGEILKNLDEL